MRAYSLSRTRSHVAACTDCRTIGHLRRGVQSDVFYVNDQNIHSAIFVASWTFYVAERADERVTASQYDQSLIQSHAVVCVTHARTSRGSCFTRGLAWRRRVDVLVTIFFYDVHVTCVKCQSLQSAMTHVARVVLRVVDTTASTLTRLPAIKNISTISVVTVAFFFFFFFFSRCNSPFTPNSFLVRSEKMLPNGLKLFGNAVDVVATVGRGWMERVL